MTADHSDEPRRSMSSSDSNASFSLFGGRVNGGSYAAPSNSRRHSTHSLHRFPSLTSVTELFQARPRARMGPALMRRKITHLFNPTQHRRSSSDTTFLSRDIAPRQHTAAPVVPPPLRLDDSSFVDDWSAIARDIEHSVSSRRPSSSSASTGVRPFSCPAPISTAAPIIPESPTTLTMPTSHRRHRSSAGRRTKRMTTKEIVATNARPANESLIRALSAMVEVSFETDVVDIVGCPNTAVTYSLPGSVSLTFPALPNVEQEQVRLLHDVSVVLEGKAEYWDDYGRFTPFRLFTTTLPLIPADSPIIIPSSESPDSPFVTVRLDFDLRLPGWLPPSIRVSGKGSCAGVGYGVVATAVTSWCDRRLSPFVHELVGRAQKSSCSRYTEFAIRRHQMPTAIFPNAPIEQRSFIHTEQQTFSYDINLGTAILPIEATFTVPDVVDIWGNERALTVGIRIRIQPEAYHAHRLSQAILRGGADASDPTVAYLTELGMIVEERQRFSSAPFGQYTDYFPVPLEQPAYSSQYSLLGPRFAPRDESAFCPSPSVRCRRDVLRPCLLSEEGYQRHFVFSEGGIGLSDVWRRINVVLVLPSRNGSGNYRPRPGSFTPFVQISHALKTFCILRTPGVNPELRPITFTTAIKFATHPKTMPSSGSANPPPFLQLYDESGEPRLPDPLPLYSPARPKKDPMLEAVNALLMQSEAALPRVSSDEDAPVRTPLSPESEIGSSLELPDMMPLREGIVSSAEDEEYPKPTLGRASGSCALNSLSVHEQV